MRIATINLHWPRPAVSSIGKKIIRQTSAWRAAGYEVQFFSHMHAAENSHDLVDGLYFIYQQEKGSFGGVKTEINRSQAAKRLMDAVADYQPDVIYLRWAMYVYPIRNLFRIAPVAVEINTADIQEHRLLGAAHNLYNRLTRSIILGNASGLIFATQELMDLPDFSKFHKQGAVITNSIDVDASPFYPAPVNSPPHLVFIGTHGMPWHGVEKLADLAYRFPELVIDVVGYDKINGISEVPANLILHGFLKGARYESVLANADAAIGTLSLHVNGMQEAAPLKVRDCAARGIPCILPYLDADFSGLDSDMFLQIPNSADVINTHGEAIFDFVMRVRGKRVPRSLIRSRIDSPVKEAQRLDFFNQIITKSH